MPAQTFTANAVCGHTCSLRPRSFASFLQHRVRTREASKRLPKQCVRAKIDPSEATEGLGIFNVDSCFRTRDTISNLCACMAAESSKQLDNQIVPQPETEAERTKIQNFLYPDASELSNSEMPIWDHLDELRERILIAALAAGGSILTCFCFSKDLVVFLEAPVAEQGVRFLQLSPGEFFFTTFKVSIQVTPLYDWVGSFGEATPIWFASFAWNVLHHHSAAPAVHLVQVAGYAGLLLATPTVLYEIVAWVFPGLTIDERKQLAPIVFGSSILFYIG